MSVQPLNGERRSLHGDAVVEPEHERQKEGEHEGVAKRRLVRAHDDGARRARDDRGHEPRNTPAEASNAGPFVDEVHSQTHELEHVVETSALMNLPEIASKLPDVHDADDPVGFVHDGQRQKLVIGERSERAGMTPMSAP